MGKECFQNYRHHSFEHSVATSLADIQMKVRVVVKELSTVLQIPAHVIQFLMNQRQTLVATEKGAVFQKPRVAFRSAIYNPQSAMTSDDHRTAQEFVKLAG
jgi:hypothetical protein